MALTFQETVNPEFVNYFSKMTFKDFKEQYSGTKDKQAIHSLLKKTCGQFKKNGYTYPREFNFTKGKPWGRRYSCDGGCQGLPKAFRGALCNGISTDVDMKNCHFKILLKICQDRKIQTPCLKKYTLQREEILKTFLSSDGLNREEAKDLMIQAVNAQYMKHTKYNNDFFKSFDIEMKRVQNILWEMSDLEYIKEHADGTKGNVRGSFMANLLQKIENEIVEKSLVCLSDTHLNLCVSFLSFDGFQILGDHYNNQEILKRLDEVTKEWDITWAYKEHDTSIVLPDTIEADPEEWTEEDYALEFIDKFGENFICGSDKHYIMNEFGIYKELKSAKKTICKMLLQEFTYSFLKKASHLSAVSALIDFHLFQDGIEDEFDKQTFNNVVPFDNGVFDLNLNVFRRAERKEYISKTVSFAYNSIDYSDLELILRDLVQDDCGDYFMWKLGNILRGDDKKFTVITGKGNNGKTKVVAKCIEDTFGRFFNAVDIGLVKAGGSNDNTNNATPQMMKFKDSMFNLVSELPQGVKLSCNRIKALTGGSAFQGRDLYSNDVQHFKARGQVWVDTNDLGEFDFVDPALINRLEVIPFPYTFVEEDELKKRQDENEEGNEYLKPIVVDILNTVDNYKVKFMHLMLDWYYKRKPDVPESVTRATKKILNDIDDVAKFQDDMCTVTKGLRCTGATLYDAYKSSGGEKSKKMFVKALETRGFDYKVRKIHGITQRGFEGIGLKNDIGGEWDPE
jgi:hypothetical protein